MERVERRVAEPMPERSRIWGVDNDPAERMTSFLALRVYFSEGEFLGIRTSGF